MSPAWLLLCLAACLLASAVYSGFETGFYTLSRQRVDLDEQRGRRAARLVRWLIEDDSALLVTLLVGSNLTQELLSHFGTELLSGLGFPQRGLGIATTLCLTPIVFLFAEVLPKDLFRRRPYALVQRVAPFVVVTRLALWPLAMVVQGITLGLARLFRLESRAVAGFHGREVVLAYLEEGRRAGILPSHAEMLARNALKLRSIPVSRVMQAWGSVARLRRGASEEELVRTIRESAWTRLPVVDESGTALGYVHQIEALTAASGSVLSHIRPLIALPPDLSVDRALLRLRASAARLALVGTAEAPLGIVALKDLVEEISGDIATW